MKRLRIFVRPCTYLDLFFIYKAYIECFKFPIEISCFARRPKSTFGALMFFIQNFRSIKDPKTLMHIVEINRKKVGYYIMLKKYKDDLVGHSICIRKKYQRKGLGSFLTEAVLKKAKIEKFTKFRGHIDLKNERSLKFHKKHGFFEYGRSYLVLLKMDKIERTIPVEVRYSKYLFHKLLSFFFYCSTMSILIDNEVRKVRLMNNFQWRIEEPVETWEEMKKICIALMKIDSKINRALFTIHNLQSFPMSEVKLVRSTGLYRKKLI